MRSAQEARQLFLPSIPKRFKSAEPKVPEVHQILPVESQPKVQHAEPLQPRVQPTVQPTVQPKEQFLHDGERDDAYCSVDIWIRKNKDFKPLLLAGPSGSGKTALIKEYCTSFETYYDQDLEDFLSASGLRPKNLGVIDCIESLDAKERDCLKKRLAGLKRRLIMTTEDLYAEPAKTWKKNCTVVQLKEPSKQFLKKVYDSKGLEYNGEPSFPIDKISAGHRDAVSDPIKCTRQMLLGQKTPELLSDVSFLSILLQANTIQATQNIGHLAQAMERYSFADVIDHELDSQSLWAYHELATKVNPKMTASMPWTFQWPRSLHPKKTYKYC